MLTPVFVDAMRRQVRRHPPLAGLFFGAAVGVIFGVLLGFGIRSFDGEFHWQGAVASALIVGIPMGIAFWRHMR